MKLASDTDTNPRLSVAISNYSVRHLVGSYGNLQPTANGHRTDNSRANLTLAAHHQPTYLSQATLFNKDTAREHILRARLHKQMRTSLRSRGTTP